MEISFGIFGHDRPGLAMNVGNPLRKDEEPPKDFAVLLQKRPFRRHAPQGVLEVH